MEVELPLSVTGNVDAATESQAAGADLCALSITRESVGTGQLSAAAPSVPQGGHPLASTVVLGLDPRPLFPTARGRPRVESPVHTA